MRTRFGTPLRSRSTAIVPVMEPKVILMRKRLLCPRTGKLLSLLKRAKGEA